MPRYAERFVQWKHPAKAISPVPRLPSVVCSKCGDLKLPKLGCDNPKCLKFKPLLPSTRPMASKAHQKWRAKRLQYMRNYNASYAKRSKKQRHIHMRMLQICLHRLLGLFEMDRGGEWQLYEDRLPEMQQNIRHGKALLEQSIKLFPLPKDTKDDYHQLIESLFSSQILHVSIF